MKKNYNEEMIFIFDQVLSISNRLHIKLDYMSMTDTRNASDLFVAICDAESHLTTLKNYLSNLNDLK